jgi:Zn-dependent protease
MRLPFKALWSPSFLSHRERAAIALHLGWLPFLALVAWIFAAWSAPHFYTGHSVGGRWQLGTAVALLALLSVTTRELLRAALARRYGLRLKHLTLYPYGGMAEFAPSSPNWRTRALVAGAGPVASIILALGFTLLWYATGSLLFGWLAAFNAGLAFLTALPAHPLDGARLLQAFSHLAAIDLDPELVQRVNRHGGDLLAMSLIWFGGITLLLAQSPPGLLLIALGFLLQHHEQQPPLEPDSGQKPLLDHYSVRDLLEESADRGRRSQEQGGPPAQRSRGPAGDGATLPFDRGPSLQHRVVPVTAELSAVWRKLNEQDLDSVLVVEGSSITGACSRQQLLTYLRSRPSTRALNEKE